MSMQASLRMKAAAIEYTSFSGSEAETTMLTSFKFARLAYFVRWLFELLLSISHTFMVDLAL